MFTGLILELGEVASLDKRGEGARLTVRAREVLKDAAIGDSISINGVCLTAVAIQRDTISFDVSYETLRSTNLGQLRRGDRLNLEPSLTPTSRLGGHFVSGHVDGTGTIRARTPAGEAVRMEIEADQGILRYLVEKGSIAVDGISLTVVDVMKDAFSVVIIPHTGAMTTIGFKKKGDSVNLESDILARYVLKFLQAGKEAPPAVVSPPSAGRLLSALRKSGYTPE